MAERNEGSQGPRNEGSRGPRKQGGYKGGKPGGGKPYGSRDGKPSGGKPYGNRDGKPYGGRGGESGGRPSGKPYGNRDGKPYGNRDGKPYGNRDGKPYGNRGDKPYGNRGDKPYGNRGDKPGKPYGNRDGKFEGKGASSQRRDGEFRGSRDGKPYGEKPFRKKEGGDFRRDDGYRPRGPRRDGDRPERGDRRNFDRDRDRDRGPRRASDASQGHRSDRRDFDKERGDRRDSNRQGDGRFRRDDDRRFSRSDRGEGRPARDDRGASRPPFEQDPDRIMPRDAYKSHEADAPNGGKASDCPPDSAKRYGRSYSKRKPNFAWRKGATPARMAALEVVRLIRERDAFAQELIGTHIDGSSMSREDRAFATRLVLGVVSARGTLDEVIDRNLDSPDDVQDDVRDALQISTYEIMFLDKNPWAAVDQGVEMVKAVASEAGGLANAVLRRIVKSKESFPYGNPRTDLQAFARVHAFPAWLAQRLVADLGAEAAHDFMLASNEPAPLFVAVNPLRTTDESMVELLSAAHGDPQPVEMDGMVVPGCFRLSEGRVLTDGRVRRALNNGDLFVSDASSQAVARLVLGDALPASLLEIGAGRGTKTLLLQGGAHRAWGAQVDEYVTVDNHAYKADLLTERAEKFGVQVSEALTGDARDLQAVVGERTFETVFVDAPCSGLGTLRRHPEIRWRLTSDAVEEMAQVSASLLAEAAKHVAPGGRLAFATCTVTHAENNAIVTGFLGSEAGADFKLVPVGGKSCFSVALKPGSPDAHFLVVMERAK